jgi:L-threonylcarbamoyladenylate synthase
MQTFYTDSAKVAAEFIHHGGITAFPTETVYGLGANVFNETAIAKIFDAKQRPNDNPLIAHVANLNQINLLTYDISKNAQQFIDAFFPSPLTLVLPKRTEVPLIATANLNTIGVRMPKNKLAREFIEYCGTPIVAPSANLSGKPSPTTWQAVSEDLDGKIDCILQGEATEIGLESTVVDCTTDIPYILRTGSITLEQLREVVANTQLYRLQKNETAKSPGLKHRHYSPCAKVILITENGKWKMENDCAFIGLNLPKFKVDLLKICRNVEEYAHEVFAFFRECDSKSITTIYCETVAEQGLGLALMDRLKRAAQG